MPIDLSSTEALLQSVTGRTDDEILADVAAAGGVDAVLDSMFGDMQASFVADASAEKRTVIKHEMAHPDGVANYSLVVEGGKCEVIKDLDETPRATVTVSFLDYLRLATKELAPMTAFAGQRFKIAGDMSVMMTMAKWFPEAS